MRATHNLLSNQFRIFASPLKIPQLVAFARNWSSLHWALPDRCPRSKRLLDMQTSFNMVIRFSKQQTEVFRIVYYTGSLTPSLPVNAVWQLIVLEAEYFWSCRNVSSITFLMQLIFVYLEKKTNALWKIGYYMCSCSLKTSIPISNSPSHIYQILVPNPKQCTIPSPTGERRVYLLWKIGYYTCSSPGPPPF